MFTSRDRSLSRRDWMKLSAAGVIGWSMSGWLGNLANAVAKDPLLRKSCILLWMNGGPSQTDTFDLKPGHPNGGPFKEIDTAVPGIKISEHLPKISKFTDEMAIIRSMNTKENDHGQGTYYLHTGYAPRGPIQYPSLGALIAAEVGTDDAALPNYVSIAPYRFFNADAFNSGFLGPKYAPLFVADYQQQFNNGQPNQDYDKLLKVQDVAPIG